MLSLDSGSEVTRDAWKLLPMPDVVIKKLNLMAWKDRQGEPMAVEDFALSDTEREAFVDETLDGPEHPVDAPAEEPHGDDPSNLVDLPTDVDPVEEPG